MNCSGAAGATDRMAYRDLKLEQELLRNGLDPQASKAIFDDLTAYLGKRIETIAEEYWRYHEGEDLIARQRVGDAKDAGTVLAYYAATPHYLYELSYWEASRDKQAWFRVVSMACKKYQLTHVLDFGGGVGGLCDYLSRRGIRSDYVDVAGKTFDYAAWRFKRRQLSVTMFDAGSQRPAGSYDGVFAWDVLEHIFDLDEMIRGVASLLRPKGWFITKSTFATTGSPHEAIHLAQHACYADVAVLNELMSVCGFTYRGQLKPDRLSRLMRVCGLRYAVAGIRIAPRLKHGGNFLVHERAA